MGNVKIATSCKFEYAKYFCSQILMNTCIFVGNKILLIINGRKDHISYLAVKNASIIQCQ